MYVSRSAKVAIHLKYRIGLIEWGIFESRDDKPRLSQPNSIGFSEIPKVSLVTLC
jgi:hypothetical protein